MQKTADTGSTPVRLPNYIITMRKFLIHLLGGRTNSEYYRLKEINRELKNNHENSGVYVSNDIAYRVLRDVVQYMRTVIYGKPLDEYADRIWNLLYNNYMVLTAVYLNSNVPFRLNTELDTKKMPSVAPEYEDELEFFILEND